MFVEICRKVLSKFCSKGDNLSWGGGKDGTTE